MTPSHGVELFEAVVSRTGLASWVGPGLVQRALASEGASKEMAGLEHYRRALPQIRARMAAYLKVEEIAHRIRDIEALLDSAESRAGA